MDGDREFADSHRVVRLARKFHDKEYRETYVESHSRRFLAHQMREFRGDDSQTEFGATIDKSQTIVSRLEDPNYSGWTLRTLFDVAKRLGVAVIVRFVDFPTFLDITTDQSPSALKPAPYNAEKVDQCAVEIAWRNTEFELLPVPSASTDQILLAGGASSGAVSGGARVALENYIAGCAGTFLPTQGQPSNIIGVGITTYAGGLSAYAGSLQYGLAPQPAVMGTVCQRSFVAGEARNFCQRSRTVTSHAGVATPRLPSPLQGGHLRVNFPNNGTAQ